MFRSERQGQLAVIGESYYLGALDTENQPNHPEMYPRQSHLRIVLMTLVDNSGFHGFSRRISASMKLHKRCFAPPN
jgi:hypothetical protein